MPFQKATDLAPTARCTAIYIHTYLTHPHAICMIIDHTYKHYSEKSLFHDAAVLSHPSVCVYVCVCVYVVVCVRVVLLNWENTVKTRCGGVPPVTFGGAS